MLGAVQKLCNAFLGDFWHTPTSCNTFQHFGQYKPYGKKTFCNAYPYTPHPLLHYIIFEWPLLYVFCHNNKWNIDLVLGNIWTLVTSCIALASSGYMMWPWSRYFPVQGQYFMNRPIHWALIRLSVQKATHWFSSFSSLKNHWLWLCFLLMQVYQMAAVRQGLIG